MKRKMLAGLGFSSASFGVVLMFALTGASAAVSPPCTRTISNTTVPGAVIVKAGEVVCINNSYVGGGVIVQPGGGLKINGSTISGGISADQATIVRICSGSMVAPYNQVATISGSVTITGTTGEVLIGAVNPSTCSPYRISGSVKVSGTRGPVTVFGNNIGGGLSLKSNTGGVTVGANHIAGTLTCTANVPPPGDHSSPNQTGGAKLGQCRFL